MGRKTIFLLAPFVPNQTASFTDGGRKMSASNTSPRKPLFDAVRRLIGRGFKQKEVDALDEAFERAFAQTTISGTQPHPDTGLETRSKAADAYHLHAAATGTSGIP